jgi:Dolichyl-phosphate-mannose-protein mannosyltransferase
MRNRKALNLIGVLVLVLAMRLGFLALFHHQTFSGPSTQFEQAFVAMNLVDGKGIKIFRDFPPTTEATDPTRLIDPAYYEVPSAELQPYIREVPGYAFFLAALWKIFGAKLWIYAQIMQIIFEVMAAWGLYVLARKFFGQRAALLTVVVFALVFYEARISIVPYKDIFLLYLMLLMTLWASHIFLREDWPPLWFGLVCIATGVGYYFMPAIVLYPVFLTLILWLLSRIRFAMAALFLLITVTVVGSMVWPHYRYVQAHRNDPGITPPLMWYNLWLGIQESRFYSTQEERFQEYFRERTQATGKNIEAISKEEFLTYVEANPLPYALRTATKLLYGTFLVYGNAGDATYPRSWSYFKIEHPEASFASYAKTYPLRIIGMALGTLSASILFPISVLALFLLRREHKTAVGVFFFTVPAYFLLGLMFFHYEARYLTGALVGYLPLAGYTLATIFPRKQV